MIPYQPKSISTPERVLADVPSGWKGLETILGSIVEEFCPQRRIALEIGVEFGFSTVALSNFFDLVIGVDHFQGDDHAGKTPEGIDRYHETKERLAPYENIELVNMPWEQYIYCNERHWDLIHYDARHDFHDTYTAVYWACQHAPVVLVHDITWFADVRPACERVAKDLNKQAYGFSDYNGLGILV